MDKTKSIHVLIMFVPLKVVEDVARFSKLLWKKNRQWYFKPSFLFQKKMVWACKQQKLRLFLVQSTIVFLKQTIYPSFLLHALRSHLIYHPLHSQWDSNTNTRFRCYMREGEKKTFDFIKNLPAQSAEHSLTAYHTWWTVFMW